MKTERNYYDRGKGLEEGGRETGESNECM
jgi:hypothetical protein